MTSTVQIEANASSGVSSRACSVLISVSVASMLMANCPALELCSVNDLEHPAPPCEVHHGVERALLVSESIIRKRVGIGSRGLFQGEVNEEREPHDIGAGNKPPIAAVAAVVAIVAEHEIFTRGHYQFPVLDIVSHLHPPVCVHSRVGVELGGKLIAKVILIHAFKDGEGFTLLLPVDADHAILQAYAVARNTHDTLDHVIGWIEREMEDDHVTALHLLIGQQPAPVSRRPINRLVDQQKVAYQQSPLHRFGGDAKGLHNEHEHENGDDDNR